MKTLRDLLRAMKYDPHEDETVKALNAKAKYEEWLRREMERQRLTGNYMRDLLVPPRSEEGKR